MTRTPDAPVPFKALRERWMADPAFREAYDAVGPEMEIAFAIAGARHRARLSQAQLAERIGTSQSLVARWERGASRPTTASLEKVARATGTHLRVSLS